MADNRKYYYLKLKENYFDDDSIVLLESMQDGILYSYILLKLYLKSLKHGGRLQLDESIPYTPQMIATITRQQIGTVERAIKIFLQLGLMEQMQDGAFYMTNIELLIGQSSTEGERKRRARQANRIALHALAAFLGLPAAALRLLLAGADTPGFEAAAFERVGNDGLPGADTLSAMDQAVNRVKVLVLADLRHTVSPSFTL